MRPTDKSSCRKGDNLQRRSLHLEQLEQRVVLDNGFGMTESYSNNQEYSYSATGSTSPGFLWCYSESSGSESSGSGSSGSGSSGSGSSGSGSSGSGSSGSGWCYTGTIDGGWGSGGASGSGWTDPGTGSTGSGWGGGSASGGGWIGPSSASSGSGGTGSGGAGSGSPGSGSPGSGSPGSGSSGSGNTGPESGGDGTGSSGSGQTHGGSSGSGGSTPEAGGGDWPDGQAGETGESNTEGTAEPLPVYGEEVETVGGDGQPVTGDLANPNEDDNPGTGSVQNESSPSSNSSQGGGSPAEGTAAGTGGTGETEGTGGDGATHGGGVSEETGASASSAGGGASFQGTDEPLYLNAIRDSYVLSIDRFQRLPVFENDIDPSRIEFKHKTTIDDNIVTKANDGATASAGQIKYEGMLWDRQIEARSDIETLFHKAVSKLSLTGFTFAQFLDQRDVEVDVKPLDRNTGGPIQTVPTTVRVQTVRYAKGRVAIANHYGNSEYADLELILHVVIPTSQNPLLAGLASGEIRSKDGEFAMQLEEFNALNRNQSTSGTGHAHAYLPTRLAVVTADTRFVVDGKKIAYTPSGDKMLPTRLKYSIENQFAEIDLDDVDLHLADLKAFEFSGRSLTESEENSPGLFIGVNNDDDNENKIPDLLDSGISDDDLAKIALIRRGPNIKFDANNFLTLAYSFDHLSVYSTPTKRTATGESSLVIPNETRFGVNQVGAIEFWVEGKLWGPTTIHAQWWSSHQNTTQNSPELSNVTDGLKIVVAGIDMDVDSDNNGVIDHSDWEEEIEDHDFALGKLFVLPIPASQGAVDLPDLTPVVTHVLDEFRFTLPKSLDGSMKIALTAVSPIGISPEIAIYDHRRQLLFQGTASQLNQTISLNDIGYSPSTGAGLIHVQGIDRPVPFAKLEYPAEQKPDTRVNARLLWPTNVDRSPVDTTKIMVVEKESFYYHVQVNPALRYAGASEAVYRDVPGVDNPVNLYNAKFFGLEYVSFETMVEYLYSDEFVLLNEIPGLTHDGVKGYLLEYLYGKQGDVPVIRIPKSTSLKAGLFRDYVTGEYVLAYRGTELRNLEDAINDWITNIQHGLFGNSQSYHEAAVLAELLNTTGRYHSKFHLTGHSMGGGLASFASISSHVKATVFNPAGVHSDAMTPDSAARAVVNRPLGDPGILVKYYYVSMDIDVTTIGYRKVYNAPDVLTYFSSELRLLPDPIGAGNPIEGLYDIVDHEVFLDWKIGLPLDEETEEAIAYLFSRGALYANMVLLFKSHYFDSIYFGLLHSNTDIPYVSRWNAYSSGNPNQY